MVDPNQPPAPAIGSEVGPIANQPPANAAFLQQPVARETAISALRCYRILLRLSRYPELNRRTMERLNEVVKNMPTPLTQDKIDKLPLVAVTAQIVQKSPVCAICLDDFVVSEMAKQLPCQHIYHGTCIQTWLTKRGNCPLCRARAVTSDTISDPLILAARLRQLIMRYVETIDNAAVITAVSNPPASNSPAILLQRNIVGARGARGARSLIRLRIQPYVRTSPTENAPTAVSNSTNTPTEPVANSVSSSLPNVLPSLVPQSSSPQRIGVFTRRMTRLQNQHESNERDRS